LIAIEGAGAFVREAWFWSAALDASQRTVSWRRLEAMAEVPPGTRCELVYHLSLDTTAPDVHPSDPDAFPSPWVNPGPDLTDLYLADQEAKYLWVGGHLLGDGVSTPVLRQIRAEFDHPGYIENLPAIFREDGHEDFLKRLLSLLEGQFTDVEREFEILNLLLHPYASDASRLEWLASFLALELPPELAPDKQRELVATAFTRYARRGTPAAIVEAIRMETGVTVNIVEPLQQVAWWSLAAEAECPPQPTVFGGMLGLDTVLGSCEPQGAVVGETATLDRSHLLTAEEYGVPLFDEAAHQFSVYVYAGDAACERTMQQVREVVEREKPAHTMAQLCVIPARMRIGYQATLGIDSVIAAPAPAGRLGDAQVLLDGPPAGHVGTDTRVGLSTRL
jgi:phage tail-like protein